MIGYWFEKNSKVKIQKAKPQPKNISMIINYQLSQKLLNPNLTIGLIAPFR